MSESRPAATRRAVLASGGAALLTACDLDPRADPPASPAPTSGAPVDPSVEADLDLLDEARRRVVVLLATVATLRRAYPALRPLLGPLRQMHVTHLGLLQESGPESDPGAADVLTTLGDVDEALASVRRLELQLQRRLAALSLQAASGPFARMLASMSAGVAAHLADIPERL